MDLTGHHSNPSGPLKFILDWARGGLAELRGNSSPSIDVLDVARSVGIVHRRHGWVLAAVTAVLGSHEGPLRAGDVHGAVETLLQTDVRRASVKACLAANVVGRAPRFVRVAPGLYEIRK
jgi:hypothetical protein